MQRKSRLFLYLTVVAMKNIVSDEDRMIESLRCDFDDERWDISKELRDALIAVDNSPQFNAKEITAFSVFNSCRDEEHSKR
mmetsp:Transcript_31552/g.36179  ORF Transcript_31552/g.36179 Transcript_31552/m.36179 type:complete len:81 (+) Transcript_31552:109-351(+)